MDSNYGVVNVNKSNANTSAIKYYPAVSQFSNISNFSNPASNPPIQVSPPFSISYTNTSNSVVYELFQTATGDGFYTVLRSVQMDGSSQSNIAVIQTNVAGLESWIFSHVKSFVVHGNYFLIYAGDLNGGVYPGTYTAESLVARLFSFELVGSNLQLAYSYTFPYKWANIQNWGNSSTSSSNLYEESLKLSGSNIAGMFQYMCAKMTPCMAIDDSFTVYIGTTSPYYSILSFRGTDFPPSFSQGFSPSSGGISLIGGNLYTGQGGLGVNGSTQLTAEYTTIAQVGMINSMCYLDNKLYFHDRGDSTFYSLDASNGGGFSYGGIRILDLSNSNISTIPFTSVPNEVSGIFSVRYWFEDTSSSWPYINQLCGDTSGNIYFIYTNTSNQRYVAKILSNTIINVNSFSNQNYIEDSPNSAWILPYSTYSLKTNTIFNSFSKSFETATLRGYISITWTANPLNSLIGQVGSNDGTLTDASIDPGSNGIIFATNRIFSSNLIFIIDGQRIRKIDTAANTLTTLAGQYNVAGYSNGVGTNALFSNPSGICVDYSGNIYVSDTGNLVIRKITQLSNVTTVAGTAGVSGRIDGYASDMTFTHPAAMAMVRWAGPYNDNFLVVDIGAAEGGGNLLRNVLPNGNAPTQSVPITGSYTLGTMVATDTLENIYTNGSIIRISPTGNTTIFSSVSGVTSIAVDANNNVFTTTYNSGSDVTTLTVLSPTGSNLGTHTFSGNSTSLVINEDTGEITNYTTTGGQAQVNTLPLTTFLPEGFYGNGNAPCFLTGTKILCSIDGNDTYVPIETMRKGMRVKTLKHGYMPVELLGYSRLYNSGSAVRKMHQIYECTPDNYPTLLEPLYITGCHSILVNTLSETERTKIVDTYGRVFVTDGKYRLEAYIDKRAKPWSSAGTYTVWHVALENTSEKVNYGIYANGLLVETICIHTMLHSSNMTLVP